MSKFFIICLGFLVLAASRSEMQPNKNILYDVYAVQYKEESISLRGLNLKGKDSIYVARFASVAKLEQIKYGIPASITLAQAILESNSGASRLVKVANNHFGIKFRKRHKLHAFGKDDCEDLCKFAGFTTAWESFRDHSVVLSHERYTKHVKNRQSYKDWLKALKKGGYARDESYVEKLKTIIKEKKLFLLDERF